MTRRRTATTLILIIVTAAAVALLCLLPRSCSDSREETRRLLERGQQAFYEDSILTAMHCFVRAMDLARADADSTAYFQAAVHMAMVYDQTGDRQRSYDLLRSLSYVEVTDSGAFASQYYLRLMAYYAATRDSDYARSVAYNERAIDLDRRLYHNEGFVCQELSNIGESQLMARRWDSVAAIVDTLRRMHVEGNDLYRSGMHYLAAELLLHRHQTDSAASEARAGYDVARRYHAYDNELLCLRLLCRTDSLRGDLAAYIAHRDALERLTAEVKGSEVRLQIAAIQEQNRMAAAARQTASARLTAWLTAALLTVVIAALTAVIVMLRKNYRTQRRMAEMQRESLDHAMERKRLENELLSIKVQSSELRLDRAYRDNLSLSETLAEHTVGLPAESLAFMEAVMKEKEADFLERAAQRFPHLTYYDLRLMAFIRMRLPAHSIAAALAISPSSLTTARYRLRKKLALEKAVVLEDFIAEI